MSGYLLTECNSRDQYSEEMTIVVDVSASLALRLAHRQTKSRKPNVARNLTFESILTSHNLLTPTIFRTRNRGSNPICCEAR